MLTIHVLSVPYLSPIGGAFALAGGGEIVRMGVADHGAGSTTLLVRLLLHARRGQVRTNSRKSNLSNPVSTCSCQTRADVHMKCRSLGLVGRACHVGSPRKFCRGNLSPESFERFSFLEVILLSWLSIRSRTPKVCRAVSCSL